MFKVFWSKEIVNLVNYFGNKIELWKLSVTLQGYLSWSKWLFLAKFKFGWLFEFYGISIFVGHLIPNPFLYK